MKVKCVVPVTAIVTAYDRVDTTRETIRRLQACDPPPDEILAHLDNGADFSLPDGVRVLRSSSNVGPGGGRNRMISEARNEWVASFDDDSYPVEGNYFGKLAEVIGRHPGASVIASEIRHRNRKHDSPQFVGEREIAAFVGCGCAYRKSAFLETDGYVPLPVAYGMEEVDLALQIRERDGKIIEASSLKVFHDTDLKHHHSSKITAGSIMNQALLVWARYPFSSFGYGLLQYGNKVFDNCKRGRWAGVFHGVLGTLPHLVRFLHLRKPVSSKTLQQFRTLRVVPLPIEQKRTTKLL